MKIQIEIHHGILLPKLSIQTACRSMTEACKLAVLICEPEWSLDQWQLSLDGTCYYAKIKTGQSSGMIMVYKLAGLDHDKEIGDQKVRFADQRTHQFYTGILCGKGKLKTLDWEDDIYLVRYEEINPITNRRFERAQCIREYI